jgi:CRISPR-associated protein Cas2
MARRQYLITYDVSDDKRRNRLFKTLIAGGDHVQYSVFLCALNPMELARLRVEMSETINHREDQVIIVDLGPADSDSAPLLDCLGKRYNPQTRVQII